MGTHEDNSELQRQSDDAPQLGFLTPSSSMDDDDDDDAAGGDSLVHNFQNISLTSDGSTSSPHPLRPYAQDCSYYLRKGTCKFGLNCRYNHPPITAIQVFRDSDKEQLPHKLGQIECKYYLTAGGCKYGKSCRYNHSKPEAEIVIPELNFLGLPIRLGEKNCTFYMRNGSCGYGAQCRFHHPDPTTGEGSGPHNTTSSDEPDHHSGKGYFPSHVPGASTASQMAKASWASNSTVPYLHTRPPYMPQMQSLYPGVVHQIPERSGYKAPKVMEEGSRYPDLPPVGHSLMETAEQFPERPDQPDCEYFLKTGDCKYRSGCRYHHPKSQAPKPDDACVLNEYGLPLRPGRKICWHYEQYGICKYGRACLFDHPQKNQGSTAAAAEAEAEAEATSFEETKSAGSWGDATLP